MSRGSTSAEIDKHNGKDANNLHPGKNELMTWIEYGQSKWGNIACAKWLDRVYGPKSSSDLVSNGNANSERIAAGEIISVAVHPGKSFFATLTRRKLTPFDQVALLLS